MFAPAIEASKDGLENVGYQDQDRAGSKGKVKSKEAERHVLGTKYLL